MYLIEQTKHSSTRLRQRGLREIDALLLIELATETRPGVFIMTDQDANRLIAELSSYHHGQHSSCHEMSVAELKRRIDNLRGCGVIADGKTFITVFHKEKRGLRTDPRRDPRCRRRSQRREAERRKRSFNVHGASAFAFQPAD